MPVLDCFAGSMGEKNKVRRCLFGRPDHDSLRKDLDEQLRSTKCGMKSTWNFDCDSDKPLLGRYEWTLIKQEEDVPSYYFKGYRPTKFRKMVRDSECELNSVSSQVTPFVSRISGLETEDSEDLQRDNETTPELRPSQKQSRIDEHFVKVKRPACKRRLSACSSSSESDDDRPRKSTKVE